MGLHTRGRLPPGLLQCAPPCLACLSLLGPGIAPPFHLIMSFQHSGKTENTSQEALGTMHQWLVPVTTSCLFRECEMRIFQFSAKNCFLNVSLVERHVSSLLEDAQINKKRVPFLTQGPGLGAGGDKAWGPACGGPCAGSTPPHHHTRVSAEWGQSLYQLCLVVPTPNQSHKRATPLHLNPSLGVEMTDTAPMECV